MPDAARQVILTAQGGTEKPSQLYVRYFTSRNPKSNWSRANRQRVERMMEQGRMTEAGLGLVKLAKESGAWTALQEVQESVIPPDLSEALAAGDKAEENFMAFRPSSKRIILEWILNAKRPETRRRRIEETVRLAEQNIRADHPRQ